MSLASRRAGQAATTLRPTTAAPVADMKYDEPTQRLFDDLRTNANIALTNEKLRNELGASAVNTLGKDIKKAGDLVDLVTACAAIYLVSEKYPKTAPFAAVTTFNGHYISAKKSVKADHKIAKESTELSAQRETARREAEEFKKQLAAAQQQIQTHAPQASRLAAIETELATVKAERERQKAAIDEAKAREREQALTMRERDTEIASLKQKLDEKSSRLEKVAESFAETAKAKQQTDEKLQLASASLQDHRQVVQDQLALQQLRTGAPQNGVISAFVPSTPGQLSAAPFTPVAATHHSQIDARTTGRSTTAALYTNGLASAQHRPAMPASDMKRAQGSALTPYSPEYFDTFFSSTAARSVFTPQMHAYLRFINIKIQANEDKAAWENFRADLLLEDADQDNALLNSAQKVAKAKVKKTAYTRLVILDVDCKSEPNREAPLKIKWPSSDKEPNPNVYGKLNKMLFQAFHYNYYTCSDPSYAARFQARIDVAPKAADTDRKQDITVAQTPIKAKDKEAPKKAAATPASAKKAASQANGHTPKNSARKPASHLPAGSASAVKKGSPSKSHARNYQLTLTSARPVNVGGRQANAHAGSQTVAKRRTMNGVVA